MLIERQIKAGVFVSLEGLKSDSIIALKNDVECEFIGVDIYSSIYLMVLDRVRKKNRKDGENERNDFYCCHLMPAYYHVFSYSPIVISCTYGNDSCSNSVCQFLGGRNSGVDGSRVYRYSSQEEMISRKSTLRWYDDMLKNSRGVGSSRNTQW